ncbi:fibronectin type III domain-containing protein [Nonomuraea sp. NPDC003709]|uniref:fibronectin type III domain-containing protein n=1 Tax=Nonomuraea sp. NPDC003709 TaxID=3154450 RepID=UPI0033AA1355
MVHLIVPLHGTVNATWSGLQDTVTVGDLYAHDLAGLEEMSLQTDGRDTAGFIRSSPIRASCYRPRFLEVPWPPTSGGGPAAPTGLRVKTSSDGTATISWTPPAGNSLEYWVYRKNLSNGQTHFARTGYPTAQRSLQDAGLDAGVDYAYYVRAVNAAGVEGTPTGVVTTRGSRSAPPAPTSLSATAGTTGDVTLTWTAPEEEVAYLVHQRDITAGETEFTQAAVEDGEATTQKIESLETGHQYEFKVTASNTVGESAPSNLVQTTANFAVPGAPTGLTATAGADATVTLRWTVPAGAAPDAYQVYHRAAGTTDFTPLDLPAETTTVRTSPLISGTAYDFKVTALNTGGEGQASTVVSATALMRPPAAPANVTATATTDGTIKLTWNAAERAGAYWVHRRDVTAGQTAFSPMDSPVEATTTTADRLLSGHTYEFKVIAVGDGGEGPASAPARAVADMPRPGAPTGLSAAGDRKVTLTWQKVATAGHYWVYRRDVTAGETGFVKQSLPALEPRADLGLLVNSHTYEFKVTAENEGGESPASAVVSARPMPPLPPKVTGLTATARAGGKVALSWNAVEGAFYWVYYRDVTAGETTLTKLEYPATSAQAEVGPFTGGHEYEFAVAGTNEAGDGPLSDRARVTVTASTASGSASRPATPSMVSQPAAQTPRPEADDIPGFPGPPSNLRVTHVGDGYVDLDWDPSRDTEALVSGSLQTVRRQRMLHPPPQGPRLEGTGGETVVEQLPLRVPGRRGQPLRAKLRHQHGGSHSEDDPAPGPHGSGNHGHRRWQGRAVLAAEPGSPRLLLGVLQVGHLQRLVLLPGPDSEDLRPARIPAVERPAVRFQDCRGEPRRPEPSVQRGARRA